MKNGRRHGDPWSLGDCVDSAVVVADESDADADPYNNAISPLPSQKAE
jgi:hypothetical protein